MISPVFMSGICFPQDKKRSKPFSKNFAAVNNTVDLCSRDFFKYQVSFGENSCEEIQKYLKKRKQKLVKNRKTYKDINLYDINRIEGIQKDIKVFSGLSLEQIKFLSQYSKEFLLQRGCNNMCVHCYAGAMPPSYKNSEDKINKIDFEDFQSLYNGFKELNKRLGFNIFKNLEDGYTTLFHDADSSMIFLQDKNGKMYDYLDLAKMLHEVTQRTVLFDTAGWNIQDKKTQERMEKLVQKAISSQDYEFIEFCVSVNPFHALNNRAVSHLVSGNFEKYKKFHDIYTSRMANVLFTFTPLIEKDLLYLIPRALPDETQNAKGYCVEDLKKLYDEIFDKLKMLYVQDYESGSKKVVKNKEQIQNNLNFFSEKMENIQTNLSINGRLTNIVTDKKIKPYKITKANIHDNPQKLEKENLAGIIDINGKLYITNWYESYPTDIQLNYKNKDKTTAEIQPNLSQKKIKLL